MQNRKIILEEKDVQEFEILINSLPVFAKNVSEIMEVNKGVTQLMQWMETKLVKEDPAPDQPVS